MSKLKSHKGMSKRIKVTKTGKLLHSKAGRSHLLTNKGNNKKAFRYGKELDKVESKRVKILIPYKI